MVAKKSAETKSHSVREYLAANKQAKVKEVQAALAGKGIEVSTALINKLKYGGAKKKRGAKRGKVAAGAATKSRRGRVAGATTTKAQSIRDAFAALGRRARPRDVIASLHEQGVDVSAAQVSSVRMAMRRKAPSKHVSGGVASLRGKRAAATSDNGAVSLNHLLAAKRLTDQLGVEAARRAIDALARLTS